MKPRKHLLTATFALAALITTLFATGCTADEAERAVEQQIEVVESIQERADTLEAALVAIADDIERISDRTVTVRESLGPLFEELPAEAQAVVARVADSALGGTESGQAIAESISGLLAQTQARGDAALERLDQVRADLAEAETDEQRFFDLVAGGIGAVIAFVTGVPAAGAFGLGRGRRQGAVEVAGAVNVGRGSKKGGPNTVDLDDVDTRERINASLGDKTRKALRDAGVDLSPLEAE